MMVLRLAGWNKERAGMLAAACVLKALTPEKRLTREKSGRTHVQTRWVNKDQPAPPSWDNDYLSRKLGGGQAVAQFLRDRRDELQARTGIKWTVEPNVHGRAAIFPVFDERNTPESDDAALISRVWTAARDIASGNALRGVSWGPLRERAGVSYPELMGAVKSLAGRGLLKLSGGRMGECVSASAVSAAEIKARGLIEPALVKAFTPGAFMRSFILKAVRAKDPGPALPGLAQPLSLRPSGNLHTEQRLVRRRTGTHVQTYHVADPLIPPEKAPLEAYAEAEKKRQAAEIARQEARARARKRAEEPEFSDPENTAAKAELLKIASAPAGKIEKKYGFAYEVNNGVGGEIISVVYSGDYAGFSPWKKGGNSPVEQLGYLREFHAELDRVRVLSPDEFDRGGWSLLDERTDTINHAVIKSAEYSVKMRGAMEIALIDVGNGRYAKAIKPPAESMPAESVEAKVEKWESDFPSLVQWRGRLHVEGYSPEEISEEKKKLQQALELQSDFRKKHGKDELANDPDIRSEANNLFYSVLHARSAIEKSPQNAAQGQLEQLALFPMDTQNKLINSGLKIYIGPGNIMTIDKIKDRRAGQKREPTAWDNRTSTEQMEAFYENGVRQVTISNELAEFRHQAVLPHEIGHAISHLLGYEKDSRIVSCHNRMLEKVRTGEWRFIDPYFIRTGKNDSQAQEEYFAEGVGAVIAGRAGLEHDFLSGPMSDPEFRQLCEDAVNGVKPKGTDYKSVVRRLRQEIHQ